jgi:cytidine deaminase
LETTIREALGDAFTGVLEGVPREHCGALVDLAAAFAQVPVSGFQVGAVALGGSGRIYFGANMEFLDMPLNASIHAEQSAVANAWMHGETGLIELHVSALPCGHCRQFLQELPDCESLLVSVGDKRLPLTALLPHAFKFDAVRPSILGPSRALELRAAKGGTDPLSQLALSAAAQSYVPYTGSAEGCALETCNGVVFSGRTAESAAFNPTLQATSVALNQHNLSAQRAQPIVRAVLTQLPQSLNDPLALARGCLSSVSAVEPEIVLLEHSPAERSAIPRPGDNPD